MANLWEDIKKFVKDGATTAVDRFEEETTLWKIHREISNLKKAVDTQKLKLGAHVYEILKISPDSNFSEDEKVNGFLAEIDNLLGKVAEKQDEYDEFKKVTETRRTQEKPEPVPQTEVVKETPDAKPAAEAPGKSKKKTSQTTEPPAEASE